MKLASALAVFLGAFLLFQVQPVIAKAILPWFGGAPSVWTTCMLCFQTLLLAGYAYAHVSTERLRPRAQVGVHLALLVGALALLPIVPQRPSALGESSGSSSPALAIVALLLGSVALPYFVLAASGPLLQKWFAAAHPSASPYRLFALSNAGSLLGLVSYPFAIEPWLSTREQAWLWSAAFGVFALVCALVARSLWRARAPSASTSFAASASSAMSASSGSAGAPGSSTSSASSPSSGSRASSGASAPSAADTSSGASASIGSGASSGSGASDARADVAGSPTWKQRGLWLALSATASALLLAVTNQMCQEVAVVPLLWVLPLALYLLSFVLCFESERWYARSWCLPVLILALTVLTQAALLGARVGVYYGVPIYSLGLFVCCMFCHGELAARRPASARLTSFYLTIAAGGALGGAFVALAAPRLFGGFDELYVALLACGVLAACFVFESRAERMAKRRMWHPALPPLIAVAVLVGAVLVMRVLTRTQPGLVELRNFFGILRVQELATPDGGAEMRYLTHGGTRHGQQYQDDARRNEPTTYYGRPSGVGLLLAELAEPVERGGPGKSGELAAPAPLRVGVVGLGAGVLAAFGRAGDTYRFYEINPLVIEVARRDFTFLGDSAATVEVVEGDARLALERESEQRFDVLVLDAFSSDAIPMHLLTVEAFELYRRHLAPHGVLALHVSTRYLDLGPLIAGLAERLALESWEITTRADDALALLDARWVLVARERELFERPRLANAGHALALAGKAPLVWTDDSNNVFAVLK